MALSLDWHNSKHTHSQSFADTHYKYTNNNMPTLQQSTHGRGQTKTTDRGQAYSCEKGVFCNVRFERGQGFCLTEGQKELL